MFTVDPRKTARFSALTCETDVNSSFVRIFLSSDHEIYQLNPLGVVFHP